MRTPLKKKSDDTPEVDLKIGEGFSDTRGYIPELGPIPIHNGLNINNEPHGLFERNKAKEKRRLGN